MNAADSSKHSLCTYHTTMHTPHPKDSDHCSQKISYHTTLHTTLLFTPDELTTNTIIFIHKFHFTLPSFM